MSPIPAIPSRSTTRDRLALILAIGALGLMPGVPRAQNCDVLGGGAGYDAMLLSEGVPGHVVATDFATLKSAVDNGARAVFVPGSATIELPNQSSALRIRAGQTVFSDRGRDGSPGGLLHVKWADNTARNYPVIVVESGSRITGLRIEGPSGEATAANRTIGIQLLPGTQGVVIDNNELYRWPWAAVSVKQSVDNRIHHNYIHDNLRSQLGYGVVIQNGHADADIHCNVFNANRHAIAGSGEPGERYRARDNLVLNGGGRGAYHQFDMHAGSTGAGGQSVHITGNVFDYGRFGTSNRSSVVIRSVPSEGPITVADNLFTQGWVVGSQTAVSGVANAVPAADGIHRLNRFWVPAIYSNHPRGECRLTIADRTTRANCRAVGLAELP
ncbi:right-handed parallel beta-helix repeat-containing protein [Mitsuaria sp. GD03876]|uniref:right-handed parallel beta-helix repeat-containing protein n=1 Tax=Mitsuaria sp. GD03876 TaxID=2975399 RepID=UPI00244B87CC|nr:right-handed parallel beta-helix repeat-containing protein [Mitsuaria sp. GD03876]MDH0867831.1 right-handed parallel beta-helix repeat-containing protein [Mitsuaria sp. GD03876]